MTLLLARLFEEYESYTTHPGVGVGVSVDATPWPRFVMQVLKYYMYCIETFYNPTQLSLGPGFSCKYLNTTCIALKLFTTLPNYHITPMKIIKLNYSVLHIMQVMALFVSPCVAW